MAGFNYTQNCSTGTTCRDFVHFINETASLLLCAKSSDYCISQLWSALIIIFNLVSMVVNCIHFFTLLRLKQSTAHLLPYMIVLQHIAVIDIAAALAYILHTPCWLRMLAVEYKILMAILSISDFTLTLKYTIIMTACLERFISLRYPFNYHSNTFIAHINKVIIMQWVAVSLVSILRDVFFGTHCIDQAFGPGVDVTQPPIMLMTFIPVLTACAVIFVTLAGILKDLYKLKKNSITTIQLREVMKATRYVLTITSIFFVCLSPLVVVAPLLNRNTDLNLSILSLANIAHSSYGILNTVIYGVSNKAYRNVIKALCHQKSVIVIRVTPACHLV